jgi:predicted Zn-dependent peptidase
VDRPGASQALLLVGVRSGAPGACDAVATDAVRWLLESRVNRRLRAEDGVAYGAGARLVENDQGSALVLRVNVDGASTARSLATVLEAAATLAREKPDPAAAARARWQLARRFAFRFDRVSDSADALEEAALREREDDAWELWPSSIAALTPARIQGAAQALGIGREVVVVVGDAAALEAPLRAAGFAVEKDGAQPRL